MKQLSGDEVIALFHPEPAKSLVEEATDTINELAEHIGPKRLVEAIRESSVADTVFGPASRGELHRVAIWILSRIVDAKNPRMEADVMALAVGMRLRQGITITEVAEKYGVTKQAISKMGVEFCEQFSLPPSHVMLPEAMREKHRLVNRRPEG